MVRRICICSKCSRKFIAQSVELNSCMPIVCVSCQLTTNDDDAVIYSSCLEPVVSVSASLPEEINEQLPERNDKVSDGKHGKQKVVLSFNSGDDQHELPPLKRLKTGSTITEPQFPVENLEKVNSVNKLVDYDTSIQGGLKQTPTSSPPEELNLSAAEVVDLLDDSTDEGSEAEDDYQCIYTMDDGDDDDGIQDDKRSDGGDIMPNNPTIDRTEWNQCSNDAILDNIGDASIMLTTSIDLAVANEEAERKLPAINSPLPSGSDKICFICGSSLANISTGLKGRINHIKRCSKKNGVTGREVKLNDDDEDFVDTKPSKLSVNSRNPYEKQSSLLSPWHGGTTTEQLLGADDLPAALNGGLAAAAAAAGTSSQEPQLPVTPSPQLQQTTMQTFFQRSTRTVNSVLMAGARRLAASAKIVASTKLASSPKDAHSSSSKPTASWNNRRSFGKQSWTRDCSKFSCPAYKKITGTDFVCDGFRYANSSLTKNYFLTHFHSDHYGGITKTWNTGVIYCSLPTATLVSMKLGVEKQYLHPLPLLTPTVIESNGKPVTVTLIDANHCPGAVMFLFEVGNRRILHVGDFRWNREFMMKFSPIRDLSLQQHRLDELFLDTTYCNEKYTLPTQDEAIRATVDVAEKDYHAAKQRGTPTLFLFGAYTIGKEKIYLSVAERLKLKVYVDTQRYKSLSSLNWTRQQMSMLTTVKTETCLWVVPLGHINMKNMASYLGNGKGRCNFEKIIGFRPTGWSLSMRFNGIINSRSSGNLTVHSVPYSEHSSFPELVDCIHCLKPKKIVPTVAVSKSQQQIDLLIRALTQKQAKLF